MRIYCHPCSQVFVIGPQVLWMFHEIASASAVREILLPLTREAMQRPLKSPAPWCHACCLHSYKKQSALLRVMNRQILVFLFFVLRLQTLRPYPKPCEIFRLMTNNERLSTKNNGLFSNFINDIKIKIFEFKCLFKEAVVITVRVKQKMRS